MEPFFSPAAGYLFMKLKHNLHFEVLPMVYTPYAPRETTFGAPPRGFEVLSMVDASYAPRETNLFRRAPPPCCFEVLSMVDAPYAHRETNLLGDFSPPTISKLPLKSMIRRSTF